MPPTASARTVRKRARTGCLKCRVRRRKCDEEKPHCRRCRQGGFECQYGTRLSFLDKNAFTAPKPNSEKATADGGPSVYHDLHFVKPRSNIKSHSNDDLNNSIVSTAAVHKIVPQESPASPTTSPAQEHVLDVGDSTYPTSHDFGDGASPLFLLSSSEAIDVSSGGLPRDISHFDTGPNESPNTQAYNTALDVLLSLGHNEAAPGVSQTLSNAETSPSDAHLTFPTANIEAVPEARGTCCHPSQDTTVRVLRHYVYDIAPWLDAGDPEQTFRIQVSQLSRVSQPILDAVLFLSTTSLLLRTRSLQDQSQRNGLVQEVEISPIEAVPSVLTRVGRYMATDPFSWPAPTQISEVLTDESLWGAEQAIGLHLSVSWLTLRLNLSWALIHEQGVAIPEMLLHSVASPSSRGWPRDLLSYDRQPVLLCARALNYCFDEHTADLDRAGTSKVDTWKNIFNSLNLWYINRPHDMKPVLELENNARLFPLLLFTNMAAIMANQIYHTTMLLLLRHRPKTLASDFGRPATMSPLKHAQIICGIGLNNSDQNGWDFSLVASFYLAAKNMTYMPQQDAVLAKVEELETMTCWDLSTLLPRLKRTWHYV